MKAIRAILFTLLGLLIVSVAVYAIAKNYNDNQTQMAQEEAQNLSIIDAANQIGLTTFAKLVQNSGMADQFSQGGPYTVFAPSNQAIENLPQESRQQLEQNPDSLKQLAGGHIYQGTITQQDLQNPNLTTVGGQKLTLNTTDDGMVTVNGVKITKGIPFNNGVIYEIDGVMMPQSQ